MTWDEWRSEEGLRIREVDERDSTWERHGATYRVYFFWDDLRDTKLKRGHGTEVWEVEALEVLDVVAWAQRQALPGKQFSVGLWTKDSHGEPGIQWLVGMDANDWPVDDNEQHLRMAMLHRRGRRVVLDDPSAQTGDKPIG